MGAILTSYDVAPDFMDPPRLNALRYGRDEIAFNDIDGPSRLPFSDQQFDLISCISVLEYVRYV
jgi:ubiquinone/menaquinone biosynthesis C-methylase UbiE